MTGQYYDFISKKVTTISPFFDNVNNYYTFPFIFMFYFIEKNQERREKVRNSAKKKNSI
jgi:malic enzyme